MRLAHHGVGYTREPPLIESIDQMVGIHRGQPYALCYPRHIPANPPVMSCPDRGIYGRRMTAEAIEAIASAAEIYRQSLASGQFWLQTSQVKLRAAQAHDENIRRSLDHRLTVAQAKGDRNLIQQLEREMQILS